MREYIRLAASDGHHFNCWRAEPSGTPKGAVIVVQEIFGVNSHIRDVANQYAEQGYLALSPAIYDRVSANLECGYSQADIANALEWRAACDLDKVMLDLSATIDEAAKAGPVGMVGYCWGGSLTYVSACRLGDRLAACSGYYGGQIVPHLDEVPQAPVMLHFGEHDHSIPLENVEKIRAARPEVDVYVYKDTGHGFNCDHRDDYHAENAAVAQARTLELFEKHMA